MRRKHYISLAAALAIIGGVYYLAPNPTVTTVSNEPVQPTQPAPAPIPVAPTLTPTSQPVGGRLGPADIYPPSDVPGETNPDITQATISQTLCNPNWSTKSIRPPASYTTNLKIQQLKKYGYADQNTKDYEEDHLISLEIGGNPTSPQNLWPEPYTASISDGGAKTKDTVENYLHKQVCLGTISLDQAQKEISTDWYAVLKSMGK